MVIAVLLTTLWLFFTKIYRHHAVVVRNTIPMKGFFQVWKVKSRAAVVAAAVGVFATGVPVARAVVLDSTDIAIGVPNTALGGFAGPFANLHIDLTNTTTATVTFTSLTHGGYLYLLGGQGAADLNVNGPYTLGPVYRGQCTQRVRRKLWRERSRQCLKLREIRPQPQQF
jgi:hypothetical protein